MKKRLLAAWLCAVMLVTLLPAGAGAASRFSPYGFAETGERKTDEGTYHLLRHSATGAEVVWLENDADERAFQIGFKTPPLDSKGANHVLEHALLCGSEKYPVRNMMHLLQGSSVAEEMNAYTADDYTCYVIRTKNESDFYNLSDVYMDAVLNPLLKSEPNIFKQQGIRVEVAGGKAQYNGIVFSELKLRSFDNEENSLDFLSGQMYRNLYGDGMPARTAGGEIPDITELTYEDVMRVYDTYYKPSNMLVYTAGKQDIDKTLRMLDAYLAKADRGAAPDIAFDGTALEQAQTVQEYNVTAQTKTADIGMMAAGPMVSDVERSAAWSMLLGYLYKQMRKAYPEALSYTVGGSAGGVYNVGLLLSQVPIAQKDELIAAFQKLLDDTAKNGVPAEYLPALAKDFADSMRMQARMLYDGFAYADDPLLYLDTQAVCERLRQDGTLLKTMAGEWSGGRTQIIVVSGNGAAKQAAPAPVLTEAELLQAKTETEAFEKWVSTPDTAEAIASLPTLGAEDFADDPFTRTQTRQETDEAEWYFTQQEDEERAAFSICFPIVVKAEDLPDWCLLAEFIQKDDKAFYLSVDAGARDGDDNTLHPALMISGTADKGKAGDAAAAALQALQNPPLDDAAALREFVVGRKNELRTLYADPYQVEYSHKLMAGPQTDRFLCGVPVGFVGASLSYRDYIDAAAADPAGDTARLDKMKALLRGALRRGGIMTELQGSESENRAFQDAVRPVLAALPQGSGVSSCEFLAGGWPSALIVASGTQDDNHVMLMGRLEEEAADEAALRVLGGVLTAKYLLPELRDKRGAYGANLSVDGNDMTCSMAGGVPVDEAVRVMQGMGSYARGLTLTERELNGFMVSAVNEFDQEAEWARPSGLTLARAGKTQADYTSLRQAILNVTLDDLRGCADLLDRLTAQGHVFAQVNKAAEAGIQFPFACRVDAQSAKVTPLLKKDLPESGDDGKLTRGAAGRLLADSLRDQSAAEQPETARFADVTPGDETADALAKLYDRRVLRGYADGTFQPGEPITRAEFCIIAETLSKGGEAKTAAFSDVPGGHWAYGVITLMAGRGYLKGDPEGTFRPDDTMTRAEAAAILRRIAADQ